jgi:PAS domain S-box-containing protein
MLMDITELKEVETALRASESKYRELAASLERKVEEKVQDLSRKNEELKESEERYHKMIDEVEDYAIILLDRDGIVQNWNKGAEKIKGYNEREIVGKSFSTFYLPEDRKSNLPKQLIEEAAQKGKADYEGWRMRKDGTTFWGSIVLTALHDDQHNVIGFSKVTRDLTRRKLADDKLKEYANQLKFQNEQLEQFAYAASHDMKEPLRKILFYNNHLWETAGTHLNDKEREYLNRSINAARRMQVLIDDLLAYSKATSDRQDYEPVDLNEVVDDILKSYKDDIEEKKAVVHVASLPVVKGTAFQLRQLFDNLISNALKYHHPERKPEIQINAEETNGAGILGLDEEEEYYKICISDNGIGFSPEFSEKIFELFQRLSGSSKLSGTGVGLALCRKITQNHHGAIKAEGRINEGASFCVYLPVQ